MSIASIGSMASSAGSYAMQGADAIGSFSQNPFVQAGGSILNTASTFLQGKAMANALKKQQDRQWKANLANVREQYRQTGQQMSAAGQDLANAGLSNQLSLAEQKAQVELMAAASGTGGASITSMLTDLNAQGGRNQSQILENFERQQEGFVNQLKGIQTSGQMVMRKFEKPKLFDTVIRGALDASSAYSNAKSNQLRRQRSLS